MVSAQPTIEAKYPFEAAESSSILTALAAVCVPDLQHPEDQINSIYFDTPRLKALAEKVDSDYLKFKLRLRWYGTPDHGAGGTVPAFLELKSKQGVRRTKSRLQVEVPAAWLAEGAESFAALESLGRHARELGWPRPGPLFPMIAIRYRRTRFTEPASASRVSVDRRITCTGTHAAFVPFAGRRALRHGVLEVKSRDGALPGAFFAIRNRLNRRDSFSKYEECWQLQASPFYRRELRWMR